ncbi:MAG: tRNA (adenosine(37)-N6)-dimethylallyltransferase MiaA [Myxococcota bacterium]|nr:tRNA (adenosine(37)-N6)-dimethylallyltransferase MiaA [Myxococcota bacterium]
MTSLSETSDRPDSGRPKVVVVTGPTGAGKTELAIRLAEEFKGEIINADSMQVYRYMDIGTAKPSLEERARVPHHLFDVVAPDVEYSAGRFAAEGRAVADDILARGRTVLLTGGTGLYIRAFLSGLVGTGPALSALRERLEKAHEKAVGEGDPGRLHRRLSELDPDAAGSIHPNDVRRTVRAMEIIEQSGSAASDLRDQHGFEDRPYQGLQIALDPGRKTLATRIDERCEAMIDAGLLQEVRHLREMGFGPELRSMQSIGYRHMQPVVDGLDTLANAAVSMQADTRRLARRQRTWLRAVEGVVWVDPTEADAVVRPRVAEFLSGP